MKILKTIVATAVIVFAATTVAMAGVNHVYGGSQAGTAGPAQTPPAVTPTAQPASVTLTAAQFASLLDRVQQRDRDRTHTRDAAHRRQTARKHEQKAYQHAGQQTQTHAQQSNAVHHVDAQVQQSPSQPVHTSGSDAGHHSDAGHSGSHE